MQPDETHSSTETRQTRLWVAAALVWLDKRHLLLQRRSESATHGAGQWELVGGKIERGESSREALSRELREEWGPATQGLQIGGVADILHHCYLAPAPEVHLIVFHVDARSWAADRWRQEIELLPGARVEAFSRDALPISRCLEADRPFLETVALMDYPF